VTLRAVKEVRLVTTRIAAATVRAISSILSSTSGSLLATVTEICPFLIIELIAAELSNMSSSIPLSVLDVPARSARLIGAGIEI
jgi:hypothetical protein